MIKKISIISMLGMLAATNVFAYVPPPPSGGTSPINSAQDIVNFFNNLAFWIGNIFWIIAVISAFWAAYLYIFKGGSDDISRAHRQLLVTVIAIAIGLIVNGLPGLVNNILLGR